MEMKIHLISLAAGMLLAFGTVSSPAKNNSKTPDILVIRPQGKDFEAAVRGLKDRISEDFFIRESIIKAGDNNLDISKNLTNPPPSLVVLMDNQAEEIYRASRENTKFPMGDIPSISLMGVMINQTRKGLPNSAGISYEIPLVTSAVSLRTILKSPVNKIGVVHRKIMNSFIAENKNWCQAENIELINYPLPNSRQNYKYSLKKGLKKILTQVDVLWVPNDYELLTPTLIREVWTKLLQNKRVPIIVGVESLVNPRLNFGTFAVLPDPIGLGVQAGEKIYEIRENNWRVPEKKSDPPISIYKVFNLKQANQFFEIQESGLQNIDKTYQSSFFPLNNEKGKLTVAIIPEASGNSQDLKNRAGLK